ncbi:MAG: cyclic nucleotide-binding/CBS domain-containing protein [Anaerolineales bacterium]
MSIEHKLHTEQVTQLSLNEFTTVESGVSVRDAIEKMRRERRNCAFITKDGNLAGILTDRDVLHRVVGHSDIWDHSIDEVMTPQPKSIKANQPTGDALKIMNELHFRNIPVLNEDGDIRGNITHFAIIRYLADHFPKGVYNLPPTHENFGEYRYGG